MANETEKMITVILGIVSIMLIINLVLVITNPSFGVTGFATASATADVEVTVIDAASITIAAGGDVNFGSLEVMDSNDTATLGSSITLENNGSIDVNITASSDGFFTTTTAISDINELSCKATCGGSCTANDYADTYVDCYNAAEPKIVGCLDEGSGSDQIVIDLNVFVPEDEPAGIKSGTVTFTASAC